METALPDGRPIPPPGADERDMLEAWLAFHRATLALKCAGLDDHQVRTPSVKPSGMTLLGLVQHMAEVERNWLQRVLPGSDIPPVYGTWEGDGFTLVPERGMEQVLADWRAEIARGQEAIKGVSLDTCARTAGQEFSLRWILIHLIEEYARHNGHADLLRECIDGTTGA
ncbi:DinB family protein [Streptomyces albipurpureus]|uniref:DinB family protein n=1 Tax=Streptomyces albipurpureus TaxID=2897419 RepID=A0ABT0UJ18_9ACTN|nr:DinB family protein [Streptomyces sp. CWNU-1]MCM2387296.1 DinB family protein [Streptomyces sp. CWNU-1]